MPVERSAAYAARHVAKNLVAAGIADRWEVQVAYAIGVTRPLSLLVETFGTEHIANSRILALVDEHFDLRPGAFREHLKLHRPICSATAAYGRFPRDNPDQAPVSRAPRASRAELRDVELLHHPGDRTDRAVPRPREMMRRRPTCSRHRDEKVARPHLDTLGVEI